MINVEKQIKVHKALKEIGIDIPLEEFAEETVYDTSLPPCLQDYESRTLKILVGLVRVKTEEELHSDEKHYDIDLINKIADAFFASRDEDLKKIAWNSFEECAYDERFSKYDEMFEARDESKERFKDSIWIYNHSPEFTTERLLIKPLAEEAVKELVEYMEESETKWTHYMFGVCRYDRRTANALINFSIHLHDGTLVGLIGMYQSNNTLTDPFAYVVQFYIKDDKRGHGYASEALKGLIDQIDKDEIIVIDFPNYYGVYEEMRPEFDILRGTCDLDNISSAKTMGKWMNDDGRMRICYGEKDKGRLIKYERVFSYVVGGLDE